MIYSSLNSACLITSVLMMAKYCNCQVCACNAGAGCGENRLFITECSTTLGRIGKNSMYLMFSRNNRVQRLASTKGHAFQKGLDFTLACCISYLCLADIVFESMLNRGETLFILNVILKGKRTFKFVHPSFYFAKISI